MIKISKSSLNYQKSFNIQSSHKYPARSFIYDVALDILEKVGQTKFDIVDEGVKWNDPTILDFEPVMSNLIWKRQPLLGSDDMDAILIMVQAVDKNTKLLGYSLLISGLTASDCESIHHSSNYYYNMTDKKVIKRIKVLKTLMKYRTYISFKGPITQVFLELGMASKLFYD
jgi:hypothetical protein